MAERSEGFGAVLTRAKLDARRDRGMHEGSDDWSDCGGVRDFGERRKLQLDTNLGEEAGLEYLRSHPSAAPPPSPISVSHAEQVMRPRAPTPSASPPPPHSEAWSPESPSRHDAMSILALQSAVLPMKSPTPRHRAGSLSKAFLARSAPSSEVHSDPPPHPLPRTQHSAPLPDPSNFPDPYPFRPPHHHLTSTTPALSSAGSSSASTRSSGYTNPGSTLSSNAPSGDYGHVHVVFGEGEDGGGITPDTMVEFMSRESTGSSLSSGSRKSRAIMDRMRRSDYATGTRSRSSSDENVYSKSDVVVPTLRSQPSYDMSWQQTVDERDEIGMTSEDDTDYGEHPDDMAGDGLDVELADERTSAVVIAEEGRGLIVRGDGSSVGQLNVQPGTTHLLIGGSSTPNSLPSFLASTLPQISTTLLALDISANFLASLPPSLVSCVCLEELNIASNPLRALPIFLAHLTSLRVLIADSTGITTIPQPLSALLKLHTMSIRRNKLHALPSWLCLLPCLESLLVDGNSFQGPWKALVDPLLAKTPMTPMYPPSTPMFPQLSATSTNTGIDTDISDADEATDQEDAESHLTTHSIPHSAQEGRLPMAMDEEHTITPAQARVLGRCVTSPVPTAPSPQPTLARTRTTPNRAYYDRARSGGPAQFGASGWGQLSGKSTPLTSDGTDRNHRTEAPSSFNNSREVRRMRSAGEIRRAFDPKMPPPETPPRPALAHYATSASSSNLLATRAEEDTESVLPPKRFASLGVTSRTPSRTASRPGALNSIWNDPSMEEEADPDVESPSRPVSHARGTTSQVSDRRDTRFEELELSSQDQHGPLKPKTIEKEKTSGRKWGFLKKMSMGKMKTTDSSALPPSRTPSRPSTARGRPPATPSPSFGARSNGLASTPAISRLAALPQIDLDLSSPYQGPSSRTASPSPATATPSSAANSVSALNPMLKKKGSIDALKAPPTPPPAGLLAPPPSMARSAKRRSFLPIDGLPTLNIPIPSTSPFLPGITATNGSEDTDQAGSSSPAPLVDSPQESQHLVLQQVEEDKLREANARALRSVMAYLKDMNDLTVSSQSSTMSMYGSPPQPERARRPTLGENARGQSEVFITSPDYPPSIPSSGSSSHLRSPESSAGLRSGTSSATMSVATTDSGGSGSEERKYKDDSGKRRMVIREIIETERTYVKSLQELVDIYIKPASYPVNMIGTVSVSTNKETVVPQAERKVVFGGLESLFSFHKESFLPALETAAAPLLNAGKKVASTDLEAKLSSDVAMAVGRMFVAHAAFMRMYSTYINNFDNSVQRIRQWVTDRDRPGTSNGINSSQLSPSSSTAQLVSLGLSMSAVSTPSITSEGGNARNPPLTAGQRKRIKAYLKRCRLNPRHSQLNLEGYLLLPVQRIPRYRLLLEELVRSTPPPLESFDDPLDRALTEISSLATNMNEGKREAESRRKLVHWQSKIRGKFPSPLVQPHRRLIMDGRLRLTRVVRKQTMSFEVLDSQGDASSVQVECLAPEPTPRPLVGILCNDLLVLCRDPSEGQDPNSPVDLWAVLRMQTLPQPASIVHGNALRIVDNKAILYFELPSTSDALTWFRAINLHIPSSKA